MDMSSTLAMLSLNEIILKRKVDKKSQPNIMLTNQKVALCQNIALQVFALNCKCRDQMLCGKPVALYSVSDAIHESLMEICLNGFIL